MVSKLVQRGMTSGEVALSLVGAMPRTEPLSAAQASAAGLLRRMTRAQGLSLGDCCCLALALERGARVMTADRAWAGLDLGVEIEVIR